MREKAAELTSVPYFNPQFMSLARPHPIWTSCVSNPWEIHKAVTACRILSGRYLTDKLQRHWTWNRAGHCLLPSCIPMSEGSLEHILLHCPALNSVRRRMYSLYRKVSMESAELSTVINTIFLSGDQQLIMQLILDCTTLPEVIKITQASMTHTRDRLLYLGRSWCYSIHRERMKKLGLFEFR